VTGDASSDPRTLRRLLWLAGMVFGLGFLAFVARGAEEPPDPFLAAAPVQSRVAGFEEITIRVVAEDGTVREFCVLLADDDARRAEGFRGKPDLAGYSGIVFTHREPVQGTFTMRGVPIPLSIAFFDAGGTFNGALGMEPCPEDGACPSYAPQAPFRTALEVPEGQLSAMGVGPGARLEVGGACPAAT